MRIIAGKYRRRKLLANPGLTTRPITDRVKERLFENLGGELHGERVADVFSGTGSLGLEAISRGADRCVFYEQDRKAHELLQRNVATLEIEDQVLCWKTNVLRCSFQPKGVNGFLPYDLIFFDPPYVMLQELQPGKPIYEALERLGRPEVSAPGALLFLRYPPRTEFTVPPCWEFAWDLDFSNMRIDAFRKPQG